MLPASAAISAAARTFDKLKVLLDEIETEWADTQQTSARHCVSGNHRGATNPAEDRTVSVVSFDETRQLPSSDDGRIVLALMKQQPRAGWTDAAKRIAEAADDSLVWPEFGSTDDDELKW